MQPLTIASDFDLLTEVSGLAFNLYTLPEVLFEGCAVKNTIFLGNGEVDSELPVLSARFLGCGLGLQKIVEKEKEWVLAY